MKHGLWVLLVLSGCDNRGQEGTACISEGTLLAPVYRCDPGLVCNTARHPTVCELPYSGGSGSPCASDQNCRLELWCPVGANVTCAPRIKQGEACPSGIGCEAGLQCLKTADAGVYCSP